VRQFPSAEIVGQAEPSEEAIVQQIVAQLIATLRATSPAPEPITEEEAQRRRDALYELVAETQRLGL
jgi:hypothetical protein